MKIEMGKQYRTRDGREVRIYAVDGGSNYPVHAATKGGDGWYVNKWASDGRYNTGVVESPSDLIEVKPRIKRECWVNVYRDGKPGLHDSKQSATVYASCDRIACVKIEIDCEEGEGLSDED
jgi:hypothetical protein